MTLRARLALGITAIIILLIAPVAYAVRSLTTISDAIRFAELQLDGFTSARVANATESITTSTELALGALMGAVLLATAIAVWLTLSISRPVRDLERGMRAVASGDFAYRLEVGE